MHLPHPLFTTVCSHLGAPVTPRKIIFALIERTVAILGTLAPEASAINKQFSYDKYKDLAPLRGDERFLYYTRVDP